MATYEDALKKYPDWAWAFNIPQVGDLLRKGVDDPNYDPIPEIMQTDWYKQTQASSRQWQALQAKDPASANAQLQQEQAHIADLRSKMGIAPDDNWVRDAATKAKTYNWSDEQLNDYLTNLLQYNPTVSQQAGTVSSTMSQLKQTASNYLITLSDQTAFDYAKSILAGQHSIDDWTGVWQRQAAQQFPAIAGEISKGITPTQYFSPFKDRIATALQVNPETIDLTSNKWSKVLDVADDKGNHRPMTYNEVDQYVRSQDEWKSTRQGQQAAADAAQTLLTTFGKVAS